MKQSKAKWILCAAMLATGAVWGQYPAVVSEVPSILSWGSIARDNGQGWTVVYNRGNNNQPRSNFLLMETDLDGSSSVEVATFSQSIPDPDVQEMKISGSDNVFFCGSMGVQMGMGHFSINDVFYNGGNIRLIPMQALNCPQHTNCQLDLQRFTDLEVLHCGGYDWMVFISGRTACASDTMERSVLLQVSYNPAAPGASISVILDTGSPTYFDDLTVTDNQKHLVVAGHKHLSHASHMHIHDLAAPCGPVIMNPPLHIWSYVSTYSNQMAAPLTNDLFATVSYAYANIQGNDLVGHMLSVYQAMGNGAVNLVCSWLIDPLPLPAYVPFRNCYEEMVYDQKKNQICFLYHDSNGNSHIYQVGLDNSACPTQSISWDYPAGALALSIDRLNYPWLCLTSMNLNLPSPLTIVQPNLITRRCIPSRPINQANHWYNDLDILYNSLVYGSFVGAQVIPLQPLLSNTQRITVCR